VSDRAAIEAAIPHREPFLLVDQIVACDANSIQCRKQFTGDEYFFAGHYPGQPIVPGVLLCEAGMQAGAILLSRRISESSAGEQRVPVATRLNDVRFKRIVRPGETIDIDVTLDEELSGAFFMSAKITVNGKPATRFQFACTLAAALPVE
jgi:3-hydroxyacyl-[acyl-carrier-protein] dehydratase